MTATLAAMFIEEGKLRWDTTIAEVFPELKGKMDKRYEEVTVEQLLTHRGGVPGKPPSVGRGKSDLDESGGPVHGSSGALALCLAGCIWWRDLF